MHKELKSVLALEIACLLLASCGTFADDTPETLVTRPDGTLMWNGFELVREDFYGRADQVFVPKNVLSPNDRTLTMYFSNSSGSDSMKYGVNEVIQVNIDDEWHSLPRLLIAKEQPLLLPPFIHDTENLRERLPTEYTIDLSVFGTLPPGRYRLAERFFLERLQSEEYYFVYFWVV